MNSKLYDVGLPFMIMIGCLLGIGYNSAYLKSNDLSQGLSLVLGSALTYLQVNNKIPIRLVNKIEDEEENEK